MISLLIFLAILVVFSAAGGWRKAAHHAKGHPIEAVLIFVAFWVALGLLGLLVR
jgi:hypothetical protein